MHTSQQTRLNRLGGDDELSSSSSSTGLNMYLPVPDDEPARSGRFGEGAEKAFLK